jgi:hypothetical protein
MSLSDVIASFDLHEIIGGDFDARRTKAYVTTNVVNGTLMDTSTGETRLGDQAVTIAADGTGTITTWAPGADGNPISWQTSLVVDYPRAGHRDRVRRTFGPYTITGTSKTVTNKALTSNVATITTSAAHGLVVGNTVTIAGVDATFNGTYTLTAVTADTVSYAKTASNVTSVAATGTLTSPNIKLTSLEEEQAVPAEYLTQVTATLDTYVAAAQTAETNAETAQAAAEAALAATVDISGIATPDALVEDLVLNTGGAGPLTSAALSATFATPLGAQRLSRAQVDRTLSLAASQQKYADAAGFAEHWATGADWNTAATLVLATDKFYGGASGQLSTRPVTAGTRRYRTTLTTVAAGAERLVMAGWSNAVDPSPGDAWGLVAVGVHFNFTAGVHKIVTWDQGGEVAVSDYTPGITLYVTVWQDDLWCGVEITDSTGVVVFSLRKALTAYTPTQVAVWNSDARGATGDWLGPVIGRDESVTPVDTALEVLAPSGILTDDKSLGTRIRVALPKGYDSRVPAPVLLFVHGFGGSARSITSDGDTPLHAVIAELLDNGWIVAASDAYDTGEVGSRYYAYWDLYRYVRDNYAMGPVVLAAQSFGGIAATRLLAGRTTPAQAADSFEIPDIAGMIGWYPVLDMTAMYASAGWVATAVNTAYGDLATAVAAGADPALLPAPAFRGVPMKIWHSAADTVVSKTWTNTFAARLAGSNDIEVVATTGDHGDASNFDAAEVLATVNGWIGR